MVEEDPFVQRVLLDMHLQLCEHFTREWLKVAPILVGDRLAGFVGLSMKEYFAESNPFPCTHYDRLLRIRQAFWAANGEYHRAHAEFKAASLSFNGANAALYSFLSNNSVTFSASAFHENGDRFLRAIPAFSLTFSKLGEAFNKRLEIYVHLARLFGRESTLTEAWLGRTVTRDLLDVFCGIIVEPS